MKNFARKKKKKVIQFRCFSFLTNLKCCVNGIVWHYEAEVCGIFLEIIGISHFRRELSGANNGLEIAALTSICHADVKLVLVTGACDSR